MGDGLSPQNKKLVTLVMVVLLLAVDFALSSGGHMEHVSRPEDLGPHGHFSDLEAPEFHRSKTFPRLGSIALNLTPCLHHSSPRAEMGFTCSHDLYSAMLGAHGNGDHWGNAYRLFNEYFEHKWLREQERYRAQGIGSPQELIDLNLAAHGVSRESLATVCAGKDKPLESSLDLPFLDGVNVSTMTRILLSSTCRFAPFMNPGDIPESWRWGQADYHEGHTHGPAGEVLEHSADAYRPLTGETEDALAAHALTGHDHSGPHGLDFNTETNWLYVANSHQGQVAIVNLNVVDWGKVASYEERTGNRVLLLDDLAMLNPLTVQHYASQMLRVKRGDEKRFAESLDAVHSYCFGKADEHFRKTGHRGWEDGLTPPSYTLPQGLHNASAFIANYTDVPVVRNAPHETGWRCFLQFTGIDARLWSDPAFTNAFCTFDTRHLARYDHVHSPGRYSRGNPARQGDGDAWRCDWFIRYIEVTADVPLSVRRPVTLGYEGPVLRQAGHVDAEGPMLPGDYVEYHVNVSVGPHDVAYNPVNGLLYVTHYWQLNDPDVRMLPDWTIHILDGNPGSESFHNPWNTRGGAPPTSVGGTTAGSSVIDDEPFIIDVGGPMDGLHPTTVDVDVSTGRVFVVNRESNTISMLLHDGRRDFIREKAQAMLHGPERIGVTANPSTIRGSQRDFGLYHDPDGAALPTPEQLQGSFQVVVDPSKPDCQALGQLPSLPGGRSSARVLCDKGMLGVQGIHGDLREALRPDVEGAVLALIEDNTPWPALLQDLRAVLDVAPEAFPAASRGFQERWLDRLTSEDDRAFLVDNLTALEAMLPGARGPAALVFLAHADDRLVGETPLMVEDLLDVLSAAAGVMGEVEDQRAVTMAFADRWGPSAEKGTLLGFDGVSVDATEMGAFVGLVEPIVASTFVTGTPAWISYCLTYSVDDWIKHLADGEDPFSPKLKESDNGLHPFHCDDVYPVHYPDATPIQVDYAGESNRHHVFIIREPIGPMLIDTWYEVRPRLLQPFDLWINAGDGNIYVSNLGNHDNLPLVRGWIALIQGFARLPCYSEMAKTPVGQLVESVRPKLSCVSKAVLPPPTGFSANLLIDMDVMPHHLNVNPYTFEVYGGHLLGSYVRAGQFEGGRASWTIPETHTFGDDLVKGASLVPNPHPTGMAINPSSQRLFMTHFMSDREVYVPLTDRMENMGRYTGVMDLRNYSLVNDMVYAGDHHAVADQIRPPGRGVYEQPFYNRTLEVNVDGRVVRGAPVVTADSSTSLSMFFRCTYYKFGMGPEQPWFNVTKVQGGNVRVRNASLQEGMQFDAGRCFNIFDMQPGLNQQVVHLSPDGTTRVAPTLANASVFWEYGEEHLTYGILHLFLDPDNVPPGLRVTAPHGRDRDRLVGASVQATEELAAGWVEVDVPGRAHVPKGELVLTPQAPAAGPGPWRLEFETEYQVESNGPPRPQDPDRMRVLLAWNASDWDGLNNWTGTTPNLPPNSTIERRTVEAARWSAENACCPGFRETRIPLGRALDNATDPGLGITLEFDSVDGIDNSRRGWSLVEVRIENASSRHHAVVYPNLSVGMANSTSGGLVANATVKWGKDGERDGIAFWNATSRSYQDGDRRVQGSFALNATFIGPAVVGHRTHNETYFRLNFTGNLTGNTTYEFTQREYDFTGFPYNITGPRRFNGTNLTGHWENRTVVDEVVLGPAAPITEPVLVLVQRQDVERPERLGRGRQPYDRMEVQASVDGSQTWRTVWTRDSRDGPQTGLATVSLDATSLVHAANGEWRKAFDGAAAPAAPLSFRLRFDALDPVHNGFPGWKVANPRLVRADAAVVPLAAATTPILPAETIPRWGLDGSAYAFRNGRGTYDGPLGQGGASGLACRMGHGPFGAWGGACIRSPGSAQLVFMARDLAGHVTALPWQHGRGVALVEDTFELAAFSENYWRRDETDPHGVGFPAYVFDPTPDGQGDLIPEDTPVNLRAAGLRVLEPLGTGELVPNLRGVVVEAPPREANFFWKPTRLVTEAAAMISDGPEYRRAFVVTGSDADLERLPPELQKVLLQEGLWLNASHVMMLREPEPVLTTVDEIRKIVTGEECHGQVPCLAIDHERILNEFVRAIKMAAQARQTGMRAPPVDTYVVEGTEDLPLEARERLRHSFPLDLGERGVDTVDFAFDFVARTRFEDYVVDSKPALPRLDLELLRYIVENVTLNKLNMTHSELEKLFGAANLTAGTELSRALANDTEFLATHTLRDLGYTAEGLANLLLELGRELLAVEVPTSEILNDLDRMQLSLPTHGARWGVNVTLQRPDGATFVLGTRDGVNLTGPVAMTPLKPTGDVRVTVSPEDRTAQVRVGMDVGRVERIRLRLDGDQARALLQGEGDFTLQVEAAIKSADAPAPGLFHELVYGNLALHAQLAPGPNLLPDPGFAWVGPVFPGQPVGFAHGRQGPFLLGGQRGATLPVLGDLEDLDGHVRSYEWRFPADAVADVRLGGFALAPDADASPGNDVVTNALAADFGKAARRLTLTQAAGEVVVRFDAHGATVPIPSVRFTRAGEHAVTLTVTDDRGDSDSRTQRVRVAGPARAPELLVDPTPDPEGGVKVAWQNNTGSLFLRARGRGIDLAQLLDEANRTIEVIQNETKLKERLDYSRTQELDRATLDGAVKSGGAIVNASLTNVDRLPDVLFDALLIRPGTVRVVTKQAEDATDGARMHLQLGTMPKPSGLTLPLLARHAGKDAGWTDVPDSVRMAMRGDVPLFVAPDLCNGTALPSNGVCDPDLEAARKLLENGLFDPWIFRFSLHPDVNGVPDLNTTLAQIVIMDTGVGLLYLVALDAVDDVERIEKGLFENLDRILATDLAALLDPIVPVTPYVALAESIQKELVVASRVNPLVLTASPRLLQPGLPLPELEGIQRQLGLLPADLRERHNRTRALGELAEAALKSVQDYGADVQGVYDRDVASARAEADLWVAHAWTDVSIGPALSGRVERAEQVRTDLTQANRVAEDATAAAWRAVHNLTDATNATQNWAEGWGDALLTLNATYIQENVTRLQANVTAALNNLTSHLKPLYENLTRPVIDRLERPAASAGLHLAPENESLMLGYDQPTGRVFVRAGDRILDEGVLRASARPAKVHAAMSFTSIANHTAEVQAFWAGDGAELVDGFNRDAPAPRAANWTWASLGKTRTVGEATTRVVATPDERAQEYLYATRSAEGILGTEAAREHHANRHRFAADALASPPDAPAARAWHDAVATALALAKAGDARLPAAAQLPHRFDHGAGYVARVDLPTGALQEVRVASGSPGARSAPGVTVPHGAPTAPYIFDVRAHHGTDGVERVLVALQAVGLSHPRATHYDVVAAPRPDPALGTLVGTIPADKGTAGWIPPHLGQPGWTPGVDYLALGLNGTLPDGWRYLYARARSDGDPAGPWSLPYRVPPTLVEERFGLLPARRMDGYPGVNVTLETGEIRLDLWQHATARVDSCLGDRVEVTRDQNFPHDQIAAKWARSLRVQERGLDSVFAVLRALNQSINTLPLDLTPINVPRAQVDLNLCPSVRKLVEDVGNANASDLLGMIGVTPKPGQVPVMPDTIPGQGDLPILLASLGRLANATGNLSVDVDLEELVHGTPASVTWRTAEPQGPYHARVRFQVPGPQVGPLSADTPIDRLLSAGNLGLFNALIPGERFHLIQLGHVNASGNFTEVLRVDFDPHMLAPIDPEGTVELLNDVVNLERDPIGALVTGGLPLTFGIAAGDTARHREIVAKAHMDRWHTLDVYAPGPASGVYAVFFDGRMVGQLRTSNTTLAPNALRIGGTHVPTEILVDEVRFQEAIHPPAPVAEMVRLQESHDFAMVRWHQPEDGGAPIVDYNLLRRDLDTGVTEVVATAGSGSVRAMIDPDSHAKPVGRRYAYSVQPVADMADGAGVPSDARALVLPGFLRASQDTSVRHNHQVPIRDDDVLEGGLTNAVGGIGESTYRTVLALNASQAVNATGHALDRQALGAATLLTYALRTGEARDGAVPLLPLLEDVIRIVGYSEDKLHATNEIVTIRSGQDAERELEMASPGITQTLRQYYGEGVYRETIESYVGSTVVRVPRCLDELVPFTVFGTECTDAFPEAIKFVGLCDDFSRDLEIQELPFNCGEDAIGAYVSPDARFDASIMDWTGQPRTEYWHEDTAVDRQHTRMLAWRRYDLTPAVRADDDGDVAVTLRKQIEQAPSAFAVYASVESGAWIDEGIGAGDKLGHDALPWSGDVASSGERSLKLNGRSGIATARVGANGVASVPLDVPIKLDVFIPEGKSPREIGIRFDAGLVSRAPDQSAGRTCRDVYGDVGGSMLVTWGDQVVTVGDDGRLVLDLTGELDHAADLLAPRDGVTGHHAGGVPPQRGRWVTLTFDPAQLVLEWGAQNPDEQRLLAQVLDALYALRGPATNEWVPPHLADHATLYERGRPATFVERVDSVDPRLRDITDYRPPYDYYIPSWLFFRFNYDKFVEPYLCALQVSDLEIFTVGGEAYVDRLGPDIEPRLRLDAGGRP